MWLNLSLMLLFLNLVRTKERYDYGWNDGLTEANRQFALWPSVHNAARLISIHRRDVQQSDPEGGIQTEGGQVGQTNVTIRTDEKQLPSLPQNVEVEEPSSITNETATSGLSTVLKNNTQIVKDSLASFQNLTLLNSTKMENSTIDWKNPGAVKRGLIVFGGFALLSIAYLVFYRMKRGRTNSNSGHGINDLNQFRYGILNSEDTRDRMELSRVPLTMESDEEDEDLPIFDLGQKKKSMSYVNLQGTDEDIVLSVSTDNLNGDKESLLVDLEEGESSNLVDWTKFNNRSIS